MCENQAYPAMVTSGSDADVMAANELATHVILQVRKPTAIILSEPMAALQFRCHPLTDGCRYVQDTELGEISENVSYLYGGFQTRTGEQVRHNL